MERDFLKRQAESLLAQVGLTAAASTRTGRFSGGMRRRLSVAIALLGALSASYCRRHASIATALNTEQTAFRCGALPLCCSVCSMTGCSPSILIAL